MLKRASGMKFRSFNGVARHYNPPPLEGPYKYKDYINITCVRNPYARAVSSYRFLRSRISEYFTSDVIPIFKSFDKYIRHCYHTSPESVFGYLQANTLREVVHGMTQTEFLKSRIGTLDVLDYTIRLETINEQLPLLAEELCINLDNILHINQSGKYNYRDYYTPEISERVYKIYEEDFVTFKYPRTI